MEDKYNLTLEQNLFLAKKLLVENIYHSAKLEGCAISFSDTHALLKGVSADNLKLQDIKMVLDLRDAWRFVLNSINEALTLEYIYKINAFVTSSRSIHQEVFGDIFEYVEGRAYAIYSTDNRSTTSIMEEASSQIGEILKSDKSLTEKAIELFLWCRESELIWNRNQRTSLICANKLMISHGKGLLIIEEKNHVEFNRKLIEFYDTNDSCNIKGFIYKNCIRGIDMDSVLRG